MKNLGIIGFGNMGEALIAGAKKAHPDLNIMVMEKYAPRRKVATQTYGATDFTADPAGLFASSEAVIIAVKPRDIPSMAATLDGHSRGRPIISLAAGVSIETLAPLFLSEQICRYMPSLAASQGKSVTSVSFSPDCGEEFKSLAMDLASSVGTALEIPEDLIPAIIGISGSAIAFVYEFIESLALGGVKEGIAYPQSIQAVMQVLEGAVASLRASGDGPGEMIAKVSSPGGTTIRGIESLHANRFRASVMDAVSAAAARARELEA